MSVKFHAKSGRPVLPGKHFRGDPQFAIAFLESVGFIQEFFVATKFGVLSIVHRLLLPQSGAIIANVFH